MSEHTQQIQRLADAEQQQVAESPQLINSRDRIGLVVLVVIFLGGLWLMAAPFIVGYQSRSADWTNGTTNQFFLGAGVAALALATLIIFTAGALRELSRVAPRPQHRDES